jgi:hydrogenase maturation protease
MSDEAIGVRLVQSLAGQAGRFPQTEFVDLGTGGMNILHLLKGRRKAVIIDCARMNEPSGVIRRFTPDHVATLKECRYFSPHEGDLLDILALSRRIGECPETVIVFGIQPASLAQGVALSPELVARFDEYLRLIISELAERRQ